VLPVELFLAGRCNDNLVLARTKPRGNANVIHMQRGSESRKRAIADRQAKHATQGELSTKVSLKLLIIEVQHNSMYHSNERSYMFSEFSVTQ
jgi:hypothetical protein